MAYGGTFGVWSWCLFAGSAWVVGCGGKSETDGAPVSPATGGMSVFAAGGAVAFTGGSPSVSTGGRVNVGGAGTAGGFVGSGGNVGNGGAIPTGGKAASGGAAPTGGKSAVGGFTSVGGKQATGGATSFAGDSSVGGVVGTGGASLQGGGGTSVTGGASATGGSSNDAGDPLSAFCQGENSKVLYQGKQEVVAPATDYVSANAMDCCWADGVNLHARETLGFDIDVEIVWYAGVSMVPRVINLEDPAARVRAGVRRSKESASTFGETAEGTVTIIAQKPLEVGLCLSIVNGSDLFETLVYVPDVTLSSMQNQKRFQIFLLSDSTVTPTQAMAQGLGSVSLETNPILDLGRIAYVSSATKEVGFNPGQKIGDSLKATLKGVTVLGIPFVIVAEGERISFGTFMSPVSSIGYGLPAILVDDINSDWLVFEGGGGTTNVLGDPRTVAALTAAGKLIP